MTILNESSKNIKENELRSQLGDLIFFVNDSHCAGASAHQVESGIFDQLLKIGRTAFEEFLKLHGDGDVGPEIKIGESRTLRRLEHQRLRDYLSIFGEFHIERAVYGTGEKKKIEYVPLDAKLQLPESKFSFLLQDWDQFLAVETPYNKVNDTIKKILKFPQSVDSLERSNGKMSESVGKFWDTLPAPAAKEEGELLVFSADGKGVPIRKKKEESVNPLHSNPEKEEKPGGKKMALVGSVYSVDRFERTPDEILEALFRDKPKSPENPDSRPIPSHKRVRVSLLRCEKGKSAPSYDEIFGWMAQESNERNPKREKPEILLMDGQESLWKAGEKYLDGKDVVEILDLIHATSYVWDAANLFYQPKSKEVVIFAKERIKRILDGEVESVIQGLRRMGTMKNLRGKKLKKLEKVCTYFQNNKYRMRYDEYLEAGYPVASGVIEGACKNYVKDRMERSGMSWVLDGAQSMLEVRSVFLGGYWDEFMKFYIEKQLSRLYKKTAANDYDLYPMAVNS